jgi:dihydrofolate synthase/folylpolyglutamate synthase
MHEVLEYLYSLERFGIKLGLDVMKQLMDILDHPECGFRSIHVTGTNGKGSTCAFIASVLQKAGYNVGLYTSPHLVRFNERIKVNGVDISDEELIRLTSLIRGKRNGIEATFFEFTTALAFLYFAECKVDIAVIEVGMGGRLDATNVIVPEVCVITHVAFDHLEHLGKTLIEIAREKAGIVKKRVPVVIAETNTEILVLFRKVCRESGSEMIVVRGTEEWTLSLRGKHQMVNARTAVAALRVIRNRFPVSEKAIREGLATASWPGRLMVVSENPLVILDGAHNVDGMMVLRDYVSALSHRRFLCLASLKIKMSQRWFG